VLAPPVEGALAPDLGGRSRTEPLRQIPGMRKRDRTWKDEVRDRVRHRRKERGGAELPLFPEEPEGEPARPSPVSDAIAAEPGADDPPADLVVDPDLDLPLRSEDEPELRSEPRALEPEPLPPPASMWEEATATAEESLPPVERPARPLERAQAAVMDVGLLLGISALIVYFASRAAHVPVEGLSPVWPWLAGYLAALGLVYATYFTSVTGQTLGKLALDLRVVDVAGQPPSATRALVRAALGSLGVAVAFLGLLPVLFDPAKRALHDRLLRTRVVKG
jgi:uncharacterized RDD family membrane protein YckC